MALEEYIKQVKEVWTNYTLDLVNYQNKCRLIRWVGSALNPGNRNLKWRPEDGTTCLTSVVRI